MIIETTLWPFQLHHERLLDSLRQLPRDVILGAAENDGAQRAGKKRVAPFSIRFTVLREHGELREPRGRAEHTRIQEFHETPQILDTILDRCSAEGKLVLRAKK